MIKTNSFPSIRGPHRYASNLLDDASERYPLGDGHGADIGRFEAGHLAAPPLPVRL